MNEEIITETENFAVIRTQNDDGDLIFHVELGSITIHLMSEEWEEFVTMMAQVE